MMRSYELPYLADWVITSFRWLLLMIITASLALSGEKDATSWVIVGIGVLWNVVITTLATIYKRLPLHRVANVTVDLLVSFSLFILVRNVNGPLFWVGIVPVISGAIFFEIPGGLFSGIAITFLEIGWVYLANPAKFAIQEMIAPLAVNLGGGLVVTLACTWLVRKLRQRYKISMDRRQEAERNLKEEERNRLKAFYEMVETLSASLNNQVVLDTILNLCINVLGGAKGPGGQMISALLLFQDHDMAIASGRHLTPLDQQRTFTAESGALQAVLSSAEAIPLKDPFRDPELGKIIALQACASGLLIPLRRGVNTFGCMLFAHPLPGFFNADRVQLLEMISHQAVIALQNASLYKDLEKDKDQILQSQEEARHKLARDLHDGPIQLVASIAMRAEVAGEIIKRDPSQAASELAGICDLARQSTKELRHMLFTLRPLALESDGLMPALQSMADKTRETYQQNIRLEIDPNVVAVLEQNKASVVFYLCEEAVNNARKHAKASVIKIRLTFMPQSSQLAQLEVIDNGVGFNVREVLSSYEKRGSLGMINLQERADLVNGLLSVDSVPGKGTRIQVIIPLTSEAADLLQRGLVK